MVNRTRAILCVDDEKFILANVKQQLKSKFGNNFIYETADSAMEGLLIVDELMSQPDMQVLIISDWLMPEMKGDEFLVQVHSKYPKIVKILLTGHADEAAIERCWRDANLHRCLFKPWEMNDLFGTITQGFEQYS